MIWNKNKIGENAGIVWRVLNGNELSWEELTERTGLSSLELASAIGWLAREDKIYIHNLGNTLRFRIYHECYF